MRRIKSILGFLAFNLGIHRFFFRGRAVIVNFHRVDDRHATNVISCSTRTFVRFCAFFKRFFIIVSLSEFLDKLERGDDISRHLVITFDDGYRDNHDFAAVHLKRSGLPASFFIATDFIGTNRIPWWDEEAGIVSEWMTWDQVRHLRGQGFELGAHTCSHVDLGVVTGAEAMDEIVRSGQRLSQELGAPVTLFAFPYGRKHQISDENLEIVKSRFRCCVSAYGGSVDTRSDPYRLQRTPISQWHRTTYQFGLEAMLNL